MKQKNQKIGTISRTNDRFGDVGKQKHGEECENSSENNNTFLAAVTSSRDGHAMHKTTKNRKVKKSTRIFPELHEELYARKILFTKISKKKQPIRPAFFEKESEEEALPA